MNEHKTQPTEAMFSAIAARYDRCNHLFSLGIDRIWRKRLAQAIALTADESALDICCGTGDMAFALLKYSPVRQVVGIDCSERMIQLAQEKRMLKTPRRWMKDKELRLRVDDAAALRFEDTSFDAATCAFGLRNIPDRAAVFDQMIRALNPGGRIGICEFSLPRRPLLRNVYWAYVSQVMPFLGRVVVGNAEPLRYLARSIHHWHTHVRLEEELAAAGFIEIRPTPLTGGIATLTTAQKPQ
ncbi:MAG TPA: ubiquinone/menaquinone biosynthesis methyltransferase [Phycisphaerales bacterium]|nr:ubiquinone/menaquinone biosynthesis methyltransferase [Phycisphaerales bacterium]